jgi:hypothetical protein
MTVASVDLQKSCHSTTGEIPGLAIYLQQIVGLPFLAFHQTYGEELTLHLGTPVEPVSPKLGRRVRGSYVLTFRASVWTLLSGSRHSFVFADSGLEPDPEVGRRLELGELEQLPPIGVGSPVVVAAPFLAEDTGGIGLLLSFADRSRLVVRPGPAAAGEGAVTDLPEIADWELFTPVGMYLRVGPGRQWDYRPSRVEGQGTGPRGGAQ